MIEESAFEKDHESEEVETEYVKCSGCGANMIFNPETQTLSCPHCGSIKEFNVSTVASEIDLMQGLVGDNVWSEQTSMYECENCGAKVVLTAKQTADSCPFCGTSHVQKSESLLGLKPNALLPFTFDAKKALEYSKAWAKKRFFAPNNFKKNLRAENLKGVYTPCFTFDSRTVSTYVGRIGKTYTRTVGYGKNRRTETYVIWRNIAGTHVDGFNDVLITAGSKLDQPRLNKISPFDTNSSKEYDEKYLLGYMAYHYDSELNDCWSMAKSKMDAVIRRQILSKYFYDRVAYLNVSTVHETPTYKYVMLPVYVGNFNYAKKPYNFYVNGNTGKVWGKTPKSFWKIFLTITIPTLFLAGVGCLISLLTG